MIVHADQSGNHCVTGKVEHSCAVGNFCARGITERGDFSIGDDQCLFTPGSRARAIDHTDVG